MADHNPAGRSGSHRPRIRPFGSKNKEITCGVSLIENTKSIEGGKLTMIKIRSPGFNFNNPILATVSGNLKKSKNGAWKVLLDSESKIFEN